ncbi:MAG: hypothetical protein C4329_01995 [Chitinophagaceae bacterium]
MKAILLLVIVCLFSVFSFSQSVAVKGYVRSVSPGTVPVGVTNENGTPANKKSGPKDQHLIYLLHAKTIRVIPVEMWLNGEHYAISQTNVSSPVTITDNTIPSNTKKIILVPATYKNVVQLSPIPSVETKVISAAQKAKTNEAVIVYKQNGKFYTTTIKKLTRLEPLMGE